MERTDAIVNLHRQIESLSRLSPHMQYSPQIQERKQNIRSYISSNGIDVRRDLNPEVYNLYRRYFE